MSNPTRIISPAATPMHSLELRSHVRQDISDDDTLLQGQVYAARDHAEAQCGVTLVAARYKLVLDSFPGPTIMGVPYGVPYSLPAHAVLLEFGPVLAVQSIKYLDMNSVQQTLASTEWKAELTGMPARITPRFGKIWPPVLPEIGSVEIVYDAGYCAGITANATTDVLTIVGGIWAPLTVGDTVRLTNSGGALPAPLAIDTDYFVQSTPSGSTFKLAAASGGAAIDITDTGTGQSYIGGIPDGIKSWLRLRVGGLYENREDESILQRGTIVAISYVDRLLDPYRVVIN